LRMTLFQSKYRVESTRFRGWDYSSRGWYFVTICSRDRKCIFGVVREGEVHLSAIGRVVSSELELLPTHYTNVAVDSHVVMPNHLHVVIAIEGDHCFSPKIAPISTLDSSRFNPPREGSLSSIVRSYKAGVTRRCCESGLAENIWQARFHDHILRGDRVIGAVREYIRNNPENWGQDKENPFRPRP
jgi:putative transposase